MRSKTKQRSRSGPLRYDFRVGRWSLGEIPGQEEWLPLFGNEGYRNRLIVRQACLLFAFTPYETTAGFYRLFTTVILDMVA